MTDRTIRAVPPGYLAAEQEPSFTYLPESDLPPMLAEAAEPWRVDGTTGEQWYRIATETADDPDIAADADDDGPDDGDLDADDDGLDYFDDDDDLDGDDEDAEGGDYDD